MTAAATTVAVAPRRETRGVSLAFAIVLVALNLRAFLTSSGPLLDDGAMREWSGGFGMAWTYLGLVVLMLLPFRCASIREAMRGRP